VHVDGAFGLWANASEQTRHLVRGVELADSWSTDAHKTLNAPYDSGIVFVKDRAALVRAMQATGSYLLYSDQRDGMLYTPEMSRRARAIELWATLRASVNPASANSWTRSATTRGTLPGAFGARVRIQNDVVFNQVLVGCDSPRGNQVDACSFAGKRRLLVRRRGLENGAGHPASASALADDKRDIDACVAGFVAARNEPGHTSK
jgi:hypothetical protein